MGKVQVKNGMVQKEKMHKTPNAFALISSQLWENLLQVGGGQKT